MILLPVIERELRTQARMGFTYVLRVLGAAALIAICVYFSAVIGLTPGMGGLLFASLNQILLLSIWVLVPLSCADCISRERREGTLGLLFLTPLKAREIVLSKGLVHGLRALTLWLSAAPILTICFLLGGVSWRAAVISSLMDFSSICWALAAGLLASSSTKSWLRAMLLAGGLAGCFFVGFFFVSAWAIMLPLMLRPAWGGPGGVRSLTGNGLFDLYAQFTGAGFGGFSSPIITLTQKRLLISASETAGFSVIFLFAIILFAAWNVRRSWQEEPPSARRVWMEQALTTPIIGVNFFHRWLRRKLERNPIGWLEQRTWSGRMVTWGWFAVMVSLYSAVFYVPNPIRLLSGLQDFMAWSLLLLIAVSASGSFQRERETRVLELLLISPMTAGQIIWGRLRGLWGQFFPAISLMVVVWFYMGTSVTAEHWFSLVPFFCCGFATLPVIGLYFSLRRGNFISAFLSTVLVGLLVPQFLAPVLNAVAELIFYGFGVQAAAAFFTPNGRSIVGWLGYAVWHFFFAAADFPVVWQAGIALYLGRKLHRDLVHRNFPFSKGAT